MRHISEEEYEAEMERIRQDNLTRERRRSLKAERRKYMKRPKLPSTSKLVLLAVILINVQIIWFVEGAMIETGDLSSIYALVAIPAALIPVVWGYYSKSKAENCRDGIVYDMAMARDRDEDPGGGGGGADDAGADGSDADADGSYAEDEVYVESDYE